MIFGRAAFAALFLLQYNTIYGIIIKELNICGVMSMKKGEKETIRNVGGNRSRWEAMEIGKWNWTAGAKKLESSFQNDIWIY